VRAAIGPDVLLRQQMDSALTVSSDNNNVNSINFNKHPALAPLYNNLYTKAFHLNYNQQNVMCHAFAIQKSFINPSFVSADIFESTMRDFSINKFTSSILEIWRRSSVITYFHGHFTRKDTQFYSDLLITFIHNLNVSTGVDASNGENPNESNSNSEFNHSPHHDKPFGLKRFPEDQKILDSNAELPTLPADVCLTIPDATKPTLAVPPIGTTLILSDPLDMRSTDSAVVVSFFPCIDAKSHKDIIDCRLAVEYFAMVLSSVMFGVLRTKYQLAYLLHVTNSATAISKASLIAPFYQNLTSLNIAIESSHADGKTLQYAVLSTLFNYYDDFSELSSDESNSLLEAFAHKKSPYFSTEYRWSNENFQHLINGQTLNSSFEESHRIDHLSHEHLKQFYKTSFVDTKTMRLLSIQIDNSKYMSLADDNIKASHHEKMNQLHLNKDWEKLSESFKFDQIFELTDDEMKNKHLREEFQQSNEIKL
jgi:hypothetical protein